MKTKFKHPIAILLIFLAVAAAMVLDYQAKTDKYRKKTNELPYSLIRAEDRAPLPIPDEIIRTGRALRLPILMYHHIGGVPKGADKTREGLTVSAENFEAQVRWLKERGYSSVSLSDLYRFSQKQPVALPARPVIFTFDDGYADAFDNAVPILKKYGYTGAFGIITDFPGQTQGTNVYATWRQIAAAYDLGMEIVCHTQNHFDGSNPKFSDVYIYENLSGCQQDIKDHLADVEPFLIYPYGHSTPAYVAQAKKAGFAMALTVHEGSLLNLGDLMHLPRLRVSPSVDLEMFKKILEK
jgi:peptidoglycan/xylan/chitin deacetylase (PgdA/CDA1 family)